VLESRRVKNSLRPRATEDRIQQSIIIHAAQNRLATNSGVRRLHVSLDFEKTVFGGIQQDERAESLVGQSLHQS
jgi:hypothetical protein